MQSETQIRLIKAQSDKGLHCLHFTLSVYMDGPAFCGKTIVVAEQVSRIVEPRGSAGLANPLTTCSIHFESQHQESSYIFEISVEAGTFRDCGLDLRVYDGPQVGGNYIVSLITLCDCLVKKQVKYVIFVFIQAWCNINRVACQEERCFLLCERDFFAA